MDYSQSYSYGYNETESVFAAFFTGANLAIMLICLVVMVIAYWKIFEKAGEAGWKSLIPIYNIYVMFKITWGNGWMFLLLIFPFVNVVVGLMQLYKLSKSFGHGAGFFFGLWLLSPIFILILAFGSSKYIGPNGIPQSGYRADADSADKYKDID